MSEEYDSEFLAELFDTFSNKKRIDILSYLSKNDNASIQNDLTDYIGDSGPVLQRHVNKLKDRGYIEKENNRYKITEMGKHLNNILETKIFEDIKTIKEERDKNKAIKTIKDFEKKYGTEEAISMLEDTIKRKTKE